ncbi:hypothetical protein EQ500_04305, partial [Lactobacillus sp. XV13L]|nr:hypothetical protein [Lactobacillus sp. XV13L]
DYNETDPYNKIDLFIDSKDLPSNYFYRVRTKKNTPTYYSDIIKQPILSNIQGYIYKIDSSSTNDVNVVKDVTGKVTNINLPVDADKTTKAVLTGVDIGSNQYIHLVAVDRDNNVSVPYTEAIKKLEPSEENQINGQVWLDENYDGKLDIGEKGFKNLSLNLFRKTADGKLVNIKTVSTDNNGKYVFSDLRTGIYQIGINWNYIKDFAPTTAGLDSSLLEQGLYTADNKERYSLGEVIHLNYNNKTMKQNLGLVNQLGYLDLKTVPQLNFGIHFLPLTSNLDLDNLLSNELSVIDHRVEAVRNNAGLNDYFGAYKIDINLGNFVNETDHTKGLQ